MELAELGSVVQLFARSLIWGLWCVCVPEAKIYGSGVQAQGNMCECD